MLVLDRGGPGWFSKKTKKKKKKKYKLLLIRKMYIVFDPVGYANLLPPTEVRKDAKFYGTPAKVIGYLFFDVGV